MELIRLEGLTRRYGNVLALDCPRVRLEAGAIGLLGPNGAGKSTLLKVLLGLLPPTSGEALFMGLDSRRQGRAIRARVGYLPENDSFPPGLSGLESAALAGELSGMGRREALRRAHEVLAYLGLEGVRARAVEVEPAGVRQRVKLAQALVHDPEVLVLDEPTNNLDPSGRRAMLELIRSLHREFGKSVILSTHLLEDVDRVCDSLFILKEGRVAAWGRTEELRRDLRRRWRVGLRGEAGAYLGSLTSRGVALVGEPRVAGPDWEAVVDAPEGWTGRSFFELLPAGDPEPACLLTSLVPEREKLLDLFRRVTGPDGSGGRDGA